MKYLAFLTLLLFACNNEPSTSVKGNNFIDMSKPSIDFRKSTLEEAVKSQFDVFSIFNETSAFYSDNKEEILKTLRIVETEVFKEKYHFVFVDFTVGTKVYREVFDIVKMYDGNYIADYISCYTVKCPDKLEDKVEEWNKGSVRKSLE
jgi:hypothetical protein